MIYLYTIIFLIMVLLPLITVFFIKEPKDNVLKINYFNSREPRYFALSFKKKFNESWKNYDHSGIIHLSKDEKIIELKDEDIIHGGEYNAIIFVENKDLFTKEGSIFNKEIYVKQNVFIEKYNLLRAVVSDEDLTIGKRTKIIRWADSEGTFVVHDECDLGLSATSAYRLIIGKKCRFKRLYAPHILLGMSIDQIADFEMDSYEIQKRIVYPEVIRNIKYVDSEITDEHGVLKNTIITKHRLVVLKNYVVQGDIRSHQKIKIEDEAIIHGNIFSEEDIYIGNKVKIYGVVFSQGNIYISSGAIIGQPAKIKSVVARREIVFENNCQVYGYVGTEYKGRTM